MLTEARVVCLHLPWDVLWEIMLYKKMHKTVCSLLIDSQLVCFLSCLLYRPIIIRTQTARLAM